MPASGKLHRTSGQRHGTVTVKYPRALYPLDCRKRSADVELNARVARRIGVGKGGLSGLNAELGGLRLETFEVYGGASSIELTTDYSAPRAGTRSPSRAAPATGRWSLDERRIANEESRLKISRMRLSRLPSRSRMQRVYGCSLVFGIGCATVAVRGLVPDASEAQLTFAPRWTILNYMVQYSHLLDRTFSALSDPKRREILDRLGHSPASISQLARPYGMSLTGMQKHVRILEEAKLVTTEKRGRTRECRLGPADLGDAARWIERYRRQWETRLDRLEDLVERKKGAPE